MGPLTPNPTTRPTLPYTLHLLPEPREPLQSIRESFSDDSLDLSKQNYYTPGAGPGSSKLGDFKGWWSTLTNIVPLQVGMYPCATTACFK